MNWSVVWDNIPLFMAGLGLTLQISIAAAASTCGGGGESGSPISRRTIPASGRWSARLTISRMPDASMLAADGLGWGMGLLPLLVAASERSRHRS